MGQVYAARDTRLDRVVALKILSQTLASDPNFRLRFQREARLISRLDHPHICALYDVGEQDGTPFLVMQYLDGETLEQRLRRGALPLTTALKTAIEVADGLVAAHRLGIVHRDLKPGNIFLTKTGAKLLDFGLAKHTPVVTTTETSATEPNLTSEGTMLGTAPYMAPEQLEGRAADVRTDIFAFGSVFYEMVTGRRAFTGTTSASLLAAILTVDPPSAAERPPHLPRVLDRVVMTCLAKDPNDRFQTTHDLLLQLRWLADVREDAISSAIDLATPTTSRRRRDPLLIAAIGFGIVLAAIVWRIRPTIYNSLPTPVRLDVTVPALSDVTSFALSSDGRQLVFAANSEGVSKLWIRPLDDTTARVLAGTERAIYPFWSPDGRAVGFFADGKLKTIDVSKGSPQTLADAPNGRGGTWNRDGIIVYAPGITVSEATSVLMRIAASGGTPTPVTRLGPGQGNHRWPQFLPDGRHFLYFSMWGRPDTNGIYLGSLNGEAPHRLVASDTGAVFAPPNALLTARQGKLIAIRMNPERGMITGDAVSVAETVGVDGGIARGAFAASQTGTIAYRGVGGNQRRQLMWFDPTGKPLGALGSPDNDFMADPVLDRPGQHVLFFRIVDGNIDLWSIDVRREAVKRLTFDAAADGNPIWSADGQQVIFRSTRNGTPDLFEKAANGGDDRLLLSNAGVPLSVSPDGRVLLYERTGSDTGSAVWAVPLVGEPKPFPVLQSKADEHYAEFSPDGRWIAYQSNAGGHVDIYLRRFPVAGGEWQVSTGGGSQPRWRPDSKELYYIGPDLRLMAVSITPNADGQTLDAASPLPLFPTHLASGANVFPGRSQYAVAPDGRFLMNVALDEATSTPITVALNWSSTFR
jgi:serine/threonine protein kinase